MYYFAISHLIKAAAVEKCSNLYEQCGGMNWLGPVCCNVGSCQYNNDWYSQCLPTAGPSPGSDKCANLYGQCGGKNWQGPVCCNVGTCQFSNEWYSQCLPSTDTPSTTVATSTSLPTTTNQVPSTTTVQTATSTIQTATSTSEQPTGTPLPPKPQGFNPFVGAKGFINPEYTSLVDKSIELDKSIESAAEAMKKISTAIWIDSIAHLDRIGKAMKEAAKQASEKEPVLVQFVVYNVPGRDCNALASNGEIPAGELDTYKTKYIDPFAAALKEHSNPNIRVVLIIEPDSLPNLATNSNNPKCAAAGKDYPNGIAYAIATLTMPNVWMYLDAAHGGWLGWEDNLRKIVPIFQNALSLAKQLNSNANVTGFATNVANMNPFSAPKTAPAKEQTLQIQNGVATYQGNPCIDENIYTTKLGAVLQAGGLPSRFIIDTSRGGQAGIRQRWGSWCNIKGAGLGPRPVAQPSELVDAFVWVKPPGESDGVSGPKGTPRLDGFCDPTEYNGVDSMSGAPQAGEWFHEDFVQLLKNANPPLA